jgi:hypothetical protein
VPSAILALVEIVRELGGPTLPVDLPTMGLVWACTTLPLALLVLALHRALATQRGPSTPPEVAQALEAVARAEAMAQRSFQAQAQLHAALQAQGAPPVPVDMVPRRTARRITLLACALVALFLLTAGALAVVFTGPAAAPRAEHAHAGVAVWVEGGQLDLPGAVLGQAHRAAPAAHTDPGPSPGVLHLGAVPGTTLGEALRQAAGIEVGEDSITLPAAHGGSTHVANATHALRLFVAREGQAWAEQRPIAGFVLRDHDRLLLTFGDARGAALEVQWASVPDRFPP